MSMLQDIIKTSDITLQQILNNLLDAKHNLELKTQIIKPKQLSILAIIGEYLNDKGLTQSSKLVKGFLETYLKYMVSYKRLSRTEIIKAISSWIESEQETAPRAKRFYSNLK